MAANILNSPKAVEISVFVVRAFVKLREMAISNAEIMRKFKDLEDKIDMNADEIQSLFELMQALLTQSPKSAGGKGKIGFAP